MMTSRSIIPRGASGWPMAPSSTASSARIGRSLSGVSRSPVFRKCAPDQGNRVRSVRNPKRCSQASSTLSAASVTSGPMPSPGMTPSRYVFTPADAGIRALTLCSLPCSLGSHMARIVIPCMLTGLALLQAEQAVVVGRGLRGDGRVTLFDDLGPYCFVLGRPESDIREFADRILGPLAEDGRHADLLRTLDAYLRLHGSLNAVARDLFLHRNTVRQRLRRIAKLTGADLGDAEARLALQLALLGRQALERLAS